jgi:hypothetical protein
MVRGGTDLKETIQGMTDRTNTTHTGERSDLAKRLRRKLEDFSYQSSAWPYQMRGLQGHHIGALIDTLIPFILEETNGAPVLA